MSQVTAEQIRQVILSLIEPSEPLESIIAVLRKHEGKQLTKRQLDEIKQVEPTAEIEKVAGMTQIRWQQGEWRPMLLIDWRVSGVIIDTDQIIKNNPSLFAAREARTADSLQEGHWQISAIGNKRMVEHNTIFASRLWAFFVCPRASEHWDDPNYDSHAFIGSRYKKDSGGEKISDELWLEVLKEIEIPSLECAPQAGRKIERFDVRFGVDYTKFLPYEVRDRIEKLEEAHPDLFASYEDYTMFGEPRSQQEPKRPWGSRAKKPRRLTPTINYNDAEADMTYQLYFDLAYSDGYCAYGKCDASCT